MLRLTREDKKLIITKTPLRMSYVGGGSDLPSYYRRFGGAVISTAINQYICVLVKPRFEPGIRLSYSKTENVISADDIEHPLVKQALALTNIDDHIEIVSTADIPSTGTGLGSSSSFSVGLLKALNVFKGKRLSEEECASLACRLEIELCESPIGKQDQYAASYGGLRVYKFNSNDTVSVENVRCSTATIEQLDNQTLSFYIGGDRSANKILSRQSQDIAKEEKWKGMARMVDLVFDLKRELESDSVENFGPILHENWLLKKNISAGISNSRVDQIYDEAMSSGALGGKLLGAGGGGFMIFHAPNNLIKTKIRRRLSGLREVAFKCEPSGSAVILNQ